MTTASVTSNPITATVSGTAVSAAVTSSSTSVSTSGGVGPQGPAGPQGDAGSGSATTNAGLLTSGTLADARLSANVVLTDDARLSNAREWSADTVSQAEAEAGTASTRRAYTALRVFQAVAAWWAGSAAKSKLDGIAAGATANATDAQLRDRSTHTGTQAASTVTGLATVATTGSYSDLSDKPTIPAATTSASDLTSGTLADSRLSGNVVLTNDARLSDSRTPTLHASSHAAAGTDPLTLSASQISGLGSLATANTVAYSSLTGTPSTFAPSSHTHPLSELTQSGATTGQVATWSGSAWAPAAPAGGVSDGSKGDITVSGNGAAWTIAAGAVTEADLADAVRNQIFHPFLLMGG